MATIQAEQRAIDNGNGHQLSSYWYRPDGAPRGAVMVAPAMGVKQRFYADFASWLAERGFLVVTFDYLGMGQSRQVPLRQLDVTSSTGPVTIAARCWRKWRKQPGICRCTGSVTASAHRFCHW